MPYTAPTPATLKARFPAFTAVGDPVVQGAIDESALRVDESWLETDYTTARMLYAAHVLAMDGHGTSLDAQTANAAGFRVFKSGSLQLERGSGADGLDAATALLLSTGYGRRFYELLKMNKGGPRVVGGYAVPDLSWP